MQRIESWLPVVGWEDLYEVSDLGRVRSFDRITRHYLGGASRRRGQILKPSPNNKTGHLRLHLCRNGKQEQYFVHRLVLEAFTGPCPPGMESRHGPGGVADNRWPENICWGTKEDNMGADRRRDGTIPAKLSDEIVRECRRRRAAGEGTVMLAREYGVSHSLITRITKGQAWKHVT